MIREVDLVSYLPLFMREYEELTASFKTEEPEFKLIWQEKDRILKNLFILTADEWGISRFEKFLGIMPSKKSTLEERRQEVLTRWFSELPYTIRKLREALDETLGKNNYELWIEQWYQLFFIIGIDTENADWLFRMGDLIIEMMYPMNLWYQKGFATKFNFSGSTKVEHPLTEIYIPFIMRQGAHLFNGTWRFDGSVKFNGYEYYLPHGLDVYFNVNAGGVSAINAGMITERNLIYLNGAHKLDGGLLLNSLYRDETL